MENKKIGFNPTAGILFFFAGNCFIFCGILKGMFAGDARLIAGVCALVGFPFFLWAQRKSEAKAIVIWLIFLYCSGAFLRTVCYQLSLRIFWDDVRLDVRQYGTCCTAHFKRFSDDSVDDPWSFYAFYSIFNMADSILLVAHLRFAVYTAGFSSNL
jgi:hypothetical protein